MDFIAALIGSAIGAVIAGVIIWIISKLKLGLEVDNFGWAIIAGVLIGVLTNLVLSFMTDFGGLGGFLIHLIVSAGVIYGSGYLLKGLRVSGYLGALIAALAIAVVNWLATWLIGSLV